VRVEKPTKKQKRRVSSSNYTSYIYKVLKQVHPQLGVSQKAMKIMNDFVLDVMDRIGSEAGNFARHTKTKTIGVRSMDLALNIVLPGNLRDQGIKAHARAQAVKALNKYNNAS